MSTVHASPLLRKALVADAIVSGGAALLQVAASSSLSSMLNLPQALLFESGLFLVAYTLLLVVLARCARVATSLITLVVVGNVAWAVACLALVLGGAVTPSASGYAFVGLQIISVLAFAALEWAGLRTSRPAGEAGRAAHLT